MGKFCVEMRSNGLGRCGSLAFLEDKKQREAAIALGIVGICLLGMFIIGPIGGVDWTPERKVSFPGGSLKIPAWRSKDESPMPFYGHGRWADGRDAILDLTWRYGHGPLSEEGLKSLLGGFTIRTLDGGGDLLKKASLGGFRTEKLRVDGHEGTAVWSEGDKGLAVSWTCPDSHRCFTLAMAHVRGSRGSREARLKIVDSIRCHESEIDVAGFERWSLHGGSLRFEPGEKGMQVLRDRRGKTILEAYSEPCSDTPLPWGKEAGDWARHFENRHLLSGEKVELPKPTTSIAGHEIFRVHLRKPQGLMETGLLFWHCPESGKRYVALLQPGHEEDWRLFRESATCH